MGIAVEICTEVGGEGGDGRGGIERGSSVVEVNALLSSQYISTTGGEAAARDVEAAARDGEAAAREAAARDVEAAARDGEAAARDGEAAARDGEAAAREAAARDVEAAARDVEFGSPTCETWKLSCAQGLDGLIVAVEQDRIQKTVSGRIRHVAIDVVFG